MSKGVIIMNGFGTCNGRGGTISVTVFISVSRRSVEQSSVRFFFFFKSNFDFLINVTSEKTISKNCRVKFIDDSERTERKGKRKSKSIVYSVGVLIGIAQNVIT